MFKMDSWEQFCKYLRDMGGASAVGILAGEAGEARVSQWDALVSGESGRYKLDDAIERHTSMYELEARGLKVGEPFFIQAHDAQLRAWYTPGMMENLARNGLFLESYGRQVWSQEDLKTLARRACVWLGSGHVQVWRGLPLGDRDLRQGEGLWIQECKHERDDRGTLRTRVNIFQSALRDFGWHYWSALHPYLSLHSRCGPGDRTFVREVVHPARIHEVGGWFVDEEGTWVNGVPGSESPQNAEKGDHYVWKVSQEDQSVGHNALWLNMRLEGLEFVD